MHKSRRIVGLDGDDGEVKIRTLHISDSGMNRGVQSRRLSVELEIRSAVPERQNGVVAANLEERVLELAAGLNDTRKTSTNLWLWSSMFIESTT